MKVAIFSAVAVLAVLGFALADEGFNNFDNDDGGWGGWGVGRGVGSVGSIGGVSSSWGKSWGGSGYGGMGYGSGYGMGYGSGYGMGYGGAGYGKGIGKVSYVPLPIGGGKAQGSGIFGLLLPILLLFLILPNLLGSNTQAPNLVLVNGSTITG